VPNLYYKNDVISRQGRQEKQIQFIISGSVKNQQTGKFYYKGHLLNHISIFQGLASEHTTVVSSSTLDTFSMTNDQFKAMLAEFPDFDRKMRYIIKLEKGVS